MTNFVLEIGDEQRFVLASGPGGSAHRQMARFLQIETSSTIRIAEDKTVEDEDEEKNEPRPDQFALRGQRHWECLIGIFVQIDENGRHRLFFGQTLGGVMNDPQLIAIGGERDERSLKSNETLLNSSEGEETNQSIRCSHGERIFHQTNEKDLLILLHLHGPFLHFRVPGLIEKNATSVGFIRGENNRRERKITEREFLRFVVDADRVVKRNVVEGDLNLFVVRTDRANRVPKQKATFQIFRGRSGLKRFLKLHRLRLQRNPRLLHHHLHFSRNRLFFFVLFLFGQFFLLLFFYFFARAFGKIRREIDVGVFALEGQEDRGERVKISTHRHVRTGEAMRLQRTPR